jgi:hypothetical protein
LGGSRISFFTPTDQHPARSSMRGTVAACHSPTCGVTMPRADQLCRHSVRRHARACHLRKDWRELARPLHRRRMIVTCAFILSAELFLTALILALCPSADLGTQASGKAYGVPILFSQARGGSGCWGDAAGFGSAARGSEHGGKMARDRHRGVVGAGRNDCDGDADVGRGANAQSLRTPDSIKCGGSPRIAAGFAIPEEMLLITSNSARSR